MGYQPRKPQNCWRPHTLPLALVVLWGRRWGVALLLFRVAARRAVHQVQLLRPPVGVLVPRTKWRGERMVVLRGS